jgi:hypothetical protein
MRKEHLSEAQLHRYYDMAYDLSGPTNPTAHRAFGSNTIYSIFGKQGENPLFERYGKAQAERLGDDPEEWRYQTADKTHVPWEVAAKSTSGTSYDKDLVQEELSSPSTHVAGFDPRKLHATQPWVVKDPTRHYLRQGTSGKLYADQHTVGNYMPFVYVHRNTGQMRLLAGHHRATAALIKGQELPARYVIGE